MDGPEGERHVEWGARIMQRLFDHDRFGMGDAARYRWHDFTLYHSRFYAKRDGAQFSRLCVADKLSICLTPRWIYLPMVNWSGEIHEYMKLAEAGKYESMNIARQSQREWFDAMVKYLRAWVEEHRDLREDTWTPGAREAHDRHGVWK